MKWLLSKGLRIRDNSHFLCINSCVVLLVMTDCKEISCLNYENYSTTK